MSCRFVSANPISKTEAKVGRKTPHSSGHEQQTICACSLARQPGHGRRFGDGSRTSTRFAHTGASQQHAAVCHHAGGRQARLVAADGFSGTQRLDNRLSAPGAASRLRSRRSPRRLHRCLYNPGRRQFTPKILLGFAPTPESAAQRGLAKTRPNTVYRRIQFAGRGRKQIQLLLGRQISHAHA